MTNRVTDRIQIEGAHIFWRNFSGKASQYNQAGKRNFCVGIDDKELADKLIADGWNVRMTRPRDEDEEPQAYLQVEVSYANFPPTVKKITSTSQVLLDETTIGTLDNDDILSVDLVINPYNWSVNGKSGVKAYLKAMYVTIEEDIFAAKYAWNKDTADDIPFN